MSFAAVVDALDRVALRRRLARTTTAEVELLLATDHIDDVELPLLFSRGADALLEALASRASAITARRFGRVVNLYAPLYLSNACVNNCVYCGFARRHQIERVTLSAAAAAREAEVLRAEGFRHVLLVSGEARRVLPVTDLEAVVRRLVGDFSSIAIEVFPMAAAEYGRLEAAGVDGLTLYQETYDREIYRQCHVGPKADFDARLAAIEAGGEAGFRSLGIGALLGLAPWREEAVLVALHARYLAKRYWRSRIAVSFPRIRPASGEFAPPVQVSDRDLTHMLVAMRLAMPDAELVLSTREPARLRDGLISLGVTRMSAGSKTNPGGYGDAEQGGSQFDVHDQRGPQAVANAIAAAGREPVWKDFDAAFLDAPRGD